MTSSTTPLTAENIAKLKAQVEGRTDERRCRRDEAAHKLVAELIRGGRFNESALERITAMSTTVESLKLLAPVFDGAISHNTETGVCIEIRQIKYLNTIVESPVRPSKSVVRQKSGYLAC